MCRNIITMILTGLFFLAHSSSFAGSFKAIPIKLFVDEKSKTAVLRIINQGDDKVTIQLDAKSWRQDVAGKDVYEDTGDIIFFPKIANIEKGEDRIIRIGYKGKQEVREKTYRLFMQELPVAKPGEMALKFAVTMSIPIFVGPENEAITDWTAEPAGFSEESLRVKVANKGNSHIIVNKIKAIGFDETGKEVFSRDTTGWYALAGITKIFSVTITQEECLKVKTMAVRTEVEKNGRSFTLNVDREMCTQKPGPQKTR